MFIHISHFHPQIGLYSFNTTIPKQEKKINYIIDTFNYVTIPIMVRSSDRITLMLSLFL